MTGSSSAAFMRPDYAAFFADRDNVHPHGALNGARGLAARLLRPMKCAELIAIWIAHICEIHAAELPFAEPRRVLD